MAVALVAVVRILSPSSAGRSANEGASEAIVNADCVESLETFEILPFLDFVRFAAGLFVWLLMRVKKAQSDERLKCSSLPN